jgi:hypothetical protein
MSTPITDDDRSRWWGVIEYEVSTFRGLPELGEVVITSPNPKRSWWLLKNSIVEARALHTRNLCDFCTTRNARDITASDLFDNYDADSTFDTLKGLLQRLDQQYGKANDPSSARRAFNKNLAHPTKERSDRFDYGPFFNRVDPVLKEIIAELETLRGRPFPELPKGP